MPWRNCHLNGNVPPAGLESQQPVAPPDVPALLSLGKEQQYAAVQLSHYVYTLLCIISQLMTSNESMQAQMMTMKGGGDGSKQYRHNQQLEELRNLQDRFSGEKAAWAMTRDQEAKDLDEKRTELLKLQVIYTNLSPCELNERSDCFRNKCARNRRTSSSSAISCTGKWRC